MAGPANRWSRGPVGANCGLRLPAAIRRPPPRLLPADPGLQKIEISCQIPDFRLVRKTNGAARAGTRPVPGTPPGQSVRIPGRAGLQDRMGREAQKTSAVQAVPARPDLRGLINTGRATQADQPSQINTAGSTPPDLYRRSARQGSTAQPVTRATPGFPPFPIPLASARSASGRGSALRRPPGNGEGSPWILAASLEFWWPSA